MFKKLSTKLKRRFMATFSSKDIEESSNHKVAASIFRLSLRDKNADLLFRPSKSKRIVKLDDRGVYIVLTKTMLEITNHSYSFAIEIPFKRYEQLSSMFDRKFDEMVAKEEGNVVSQVSEGLNKVLQTFKNK